MRKVSWLVLVMAVLAMGVVAVNAQDTHQVVDGVLYIQDGRVNSWDVAAPVAVYCRFDYPDADDVDYSVLSSIELLTINYADEGELTLSVDAAQIDAVGETPAENTLIAAAGGYGLYRATNGSLYVVGPADASGNPYIFVWNRGDQNC
ncbi:MAG: hypothetical protein H6672_03340 [Anaerolineaceae bacterium]|nr:hypothetical protein [Anaerolineaceae bacterium]